MDIITIQGRRPLSGRIRIHGCKNAALPILAAAAAIPGQFVLHNCPPIRDVEVTRAILDGLGVTSIRQGDTLRIDSTGLRAGAITPALAGSLRSSVLFLGALLGRVGSARIPLPGGCVLGARPLDLHLSALEALGAEARLDRSELNCRGRLGGGAVVLRYPSVGATENLLLAALYAAGPVRIIGAAREPEIVDLGRFLTACGAELSGLGTPCVTLTPRPLHGAVHTILPDRMEAATYLCAAACAGGRLTLTGLIPGQLEPVCQVLQSAGCQIDAGADTLTLEAAPMRSVPPIQTGPFPAFPTDAQAPIMAALLRADGITLLEETVFENRFRHVPALQAMGAEISVAGRIARIRGVAALHGAAVQATDLRGGAAMICAALGAEGESRIMNAGLLERGYCALVSDLRQAGAEISADPEP